MENHHQVSADTDSPTPSPQQAQARLLSASQLRPLAQSAATWLRQRVHLVARALRDDWHTHKYVLCAVLLVCITTTVVVAYYLNHPQLEIAWDTLSYLRAAQHIYTRGQLVDTWRLPGYPLLIVLVCALTGQDNLAAQYSFPDPLRAQTVYALAGQDNLAAVSVVQAVLFVLATLELYVLAVLVLRQGWVALHLGLLVGTNLSLLSYIKPLMSEALALWLLVSLALAVALFIYTLHVRFLWLMTVITLVLFLTRPEWIYLPLPLFGYLLLLAARYGGVRRVLSHVLLSLILLYTILGNYAYINTVQNGFPGVTIATNILAFGKVLQYDMQDEAPPQYRAARQLVDGYLARSIKDPYYIRDHELALSRDVALMVIRDITSPSRRCYCWWSGAHC